MATYRRWGGGPSGGSGGNFGRGSYNVFGLFIAKPIAWLIAATVLITAVGALLERNGVPVLTHTVLNPDRVLHGELWRLPLWVLVEPVGLNLVFGCLLLYFVGPDLLGSWSMRRFFAFYFGGAALAGAGTCLIGWSLWPEVYRTTYYSMWPMLDALLIAWAAYRPDAQIRMFFVVPIAGRHLITFTVAVTFVYALIYGFPVFVPHFLAILFALVFADVLSVRRLFLRGRMAMLQRDYKRRTAHLRMVERDEDKPPRWMH
jgi:hypothetical protein